MPVIPYEFLPFLWIGTAISFFLFIVFALGLRKNISHSTSKMIPWIKTSGRRPPTPKSFVVWLLFLGMAIMTIGGTVLIGTTYQTATGTENTFIPPPTPVPSPTPEPVEIDPVQITLGFPEGLDPCNIEAMTLIPPEINPYELPLVYPIEPWFEQGNFLQATFTELNVRNQKIGDEIRLANKVLIEVKRHDHLPGPLNAAFTLCEEPKPRSFPVIELNASTVEASVSIGQEPYTFLRPGQTQKMELKLFGLTPGYYEVALGIEYMFNDEMKSAWAEEIVIVFVPERIQRWSAGVITYWGDCHVEEHSYRCDEVTLEEPELEPVTVAGEGESDETVAVCPLAPANRLEVGMEATVSQRLGLRLRLREEPGLRTDIYTSLQRGTRLEVINGPLCKDGYYWYEVETQVGNQRGWMAEGEPNLYYLSPGN